MRILCENVSFYRLRNFCTEVRIMSDERFENTNASRGMNETDKGYYEDH